MPCVRGCRTGRMDKLGTNPNPDRLDKGSMNINPNYYQDTEEPVMCDECGHPCHADDAVTDGNIALCGSLRGNGCADRALWDGDIIIGTTPAVVI